MPSILIKSNSLRNLFLVSSFCFITNLTFAQLERNVTIGGGLTTSNNIPFNGNADFGWTSMIFGNAGFHGSDLIIKIGFYVNNSPVNYTMQNQRIYMRLTAATDYTSANYPGTAGFTKVYDGSITYNGSGWAMVTLQTPFAYNNTQNLEVLCENGDGSKAAGFPVFRYIDVGANRTVRNFADGAFPSGPGTIVTARPNTKFVFPTPPNTNCLTNTPATDLCSAAPLISNLNGYCGNTKSTYTVSPSDPSGAAFCGNLENTSWLKFIASETTARLNIIVDNCNDNSGIQMRIYETTNCGSGTFTPKSNCWSPQFVQPGIIEATGLTPGNTYHLMIDGYAGDQCDYTIYINSGIQLALGGTYSKTDLSCTSGNDGSISVYPIGGIKPYKSFALSGSATQTNSNGVFTALAAGIYKVTITDQSNATFDINGINIAVPAQTVTVRNDTTICKGASVQLSASGATTYSWTANPTDASLTNPALASPVVQPSQTTVYTLNAQTSNTRNLIYNGDFELGNIGFASDYTFLGSNPSGNQKAYGVVNNANSWTSFFSSSCVANGGTGNMMVVDGSTNANDTVWCQTVPVLPNTNYTFSYLLQSVGINPSARMDVLINGSFVGNYNAPGAICTWQPVSHNWNSGASTTAKICIIDRETAQQGNDFAIDDIRFTYNATCSFSKNVTITVNNPVTPTFPTYGPLCEGTILIQPILPTNSDNGISGNWNPAALSANTPGNFTYTFTPNPGQCASSTGFILKVNPQFSIVGSTVANTNCSLPSTCNGTASVNVTGGAGPFNYQWNDPAAQTIQTAIGLCGGNYTVTVKDANNTCTQTSNITVTDNCCATITNPSVAQTLCQSDDPAEISVSTSSTGTNTIKFVYFSTRQTGTNMYTGGTLLKNVTPSSGIAKFDTTALAPGTFYIYAILNPTPTSTTCRPFQEIVITVNRSVTPSFDAIAPICTGGTFTLPTTSKNGITGTWSPAINNSQTTTYTFTPTAGQCARDTTMRIIVKDPVIPVFTQIDTICNGGTLTLPSISNNGISGSWLPLVNNTATTTYTFTPATGQCATTTTMTVDIIQKQVPSFNTYGPFCQNTPITLPTLPDASTNGIAGTWSPESLSTAIAGNIPYTFTPASTECANPVTVNVIVNPQLPSVFSQVQPVCSGETITLSTTSTNSISGTWLPAINNTTTTTYTFTPATGVCARDTSMTIVVHPVPAAPTAVISQQTNCTNSTGAIALSGLPSGNWVINPGNISGSGSSYTINNLSPNTYSYTVRDGNGCTSPLSNSVTINAASALPAVPVATITRQPDCTNGKGSITVNSPTGTNLVYSLNGGTPQSSPLFDNLDGGSYRIVAENSLTGCQSQPSVFYTINAAPLPSVPPFVGIAEEYCVRDRAVPVRALGQPQGQLLWYTNATGGTGSAIAPTPSTVSDGTTIYYVTQRLPGFCESPRVPLTVIVHPLPLANAGGDKEIVRGQRTRLDGAASGDGISVLWTPGFGLSDAKITTPVASPEQTTVYTITATSQKGCKSTDNMRVLVKEPRVVKIPNVISPNGDGVHDRWVIGNIEDYPDAEVEIFNRYGTQVYEVKGYDNANAWGGKLNGVDLPVGAYYYIIRLNGKLKPIAGVISIIR